MEVILPELVMANKRFNKNEEILVNGIENSSEDFVYNLDVIYKSNVVGSK